MSVTFNCPHCGRTVRAPAAAAGKAARCPGCNETIRVPAAPAEPQANLPRAQAIAPDPASVPPPLPAAPGGPPELNMADFGPPPPAIRASARRGRFTLSKPMLFGIGGGVLALVLVGVVLGFVFLRPGRAAAMRYLPDSSKMVVSIDVAGLLRSQVYRDVAAKAEASLKEFEKNMAEKTGLTLLDVSRVTMGGDMNSTSRDSFVAVIELTKAVDRDKFLQGLEKGKWTEEKVDGYVIHFSERDSSHAVHFPDNRTIVLGLASEVRSALKRGRAAQLSGPLADAVKQLDFSQTVALTAAMPEDMSIPAGALPLAPEMLKQIQAAMLHVHVRSDIRVSGAIVCRDDKVAEDIQKMVDGAVTAAKRAGNAPKEVKEAIEAVKIARSGRNVTAQATISGDVINKAVLPAIESARGAAQRAQSINAERMRELQRQMEEQAKPRPVRPGKTLPPSKSPFQAR